MTPKTLRQWSVPRNADGSYNAIEAHRWYVERQIKRATGDEVDDIKRKARADADIAEYKRDELRKELVRISDVADWLDGLASEGRAVGKQIGKISVPAQRKFLAWIDKIAKRSQDVIGGGK